MKYKVQLYFLRIQPNLPFRSRCKRSRFEFERLHRLLAHRKLVLLEQRRYTYFRLHQTEPHPCKSVKSKQSKFLVLYGTTDANSGSFSERDMCEVVPRLLVLFGKPFRIEFLRIGVVLFVVVYPQD
jgi:hypothetical protein